MSKSGTLSVADVMTKNPRTLDADSSIADAARMMLEQGIGDVLVMRNHRFCGIVTDRDIVVRAIAHDRDPNQTRLEEICSSEVLVTVRPEDSAEEAMQRMKEHSLRRLPVIDAGLPVGIVTLGDMAMHQPADGVLAEISAAPSNH